MNEHSEIIIEKMVDHFGEWEEPVKKASTTYKKKEIKVIEITKPKKEVLYIKKEESACVKERREEIIMCKAELKSIHKMQLLETETWVDTNTKNRQEELIYVKKVLSDAMSSHTLVMAS